MKRISSFLAVTLIFSLTAQPVFAGKDLIPSPDNAGEQPSQTLEASLSKTSGEIKTSSKKSTSEEFLAEGSLTVQDQEMPDLNLDTASFAVSRADRASFKALLASQGITYITDADLDNLESNVPSSDLDPRGYLLSISGKYVAIAFMGSKRVGNHYDANSKAVVFKSQVKQFEVSYPFARVFDDFQMAFTKDDRLVIAYNGQIAVESAKLDSKKRVTERTTDLYKIDTGTPVFQYTRTVLYDASSQKKTQESLTYYFSPKDPIDWQVQTFYYAADGHITGFRQSSYKDRRLVWTSFEEREDVECGQPVLCSDAVSYTREDYTYYSKIRLKQVITIFLDPDTNKLLKKIIRTFSNDSRNELISREEINY